MSICVGLCGSEGGFFAGPFLQKHPQIWESRARLGNMHLGFCSSDWWSTLFWASSKKFPPSQQRFYKDLSKNVHFNVETRSFLPNSVFRFDLNKLKNGSAVRRPFWVHRESCRSVPLLPGVPAKQVAFMLISRQAASMWVARTYPESGKRWDDISSVICYESSAEKWFFHTFSIF